MAKLKYVLIKEWLQKQTLKPESKNRMPTVAEIRRQFGVSLAPVSRALQELEREGIIRCRQGSGIVATGMSCELKVSPSRRPTDQGAVLVASMEYPSERIWKLVHTLEQYSKSKRLRVINYKVDRDTSWDDLLAFAKKQKCCKGLVALMGGGRIDPVQMEQFADLGMPIVIVDSMYFYESLPENVYCLSPDPTSSGRLLAKALLSRGHTRIGYVRNEPQCDYNAEKLKVIAQSIREAGQEFSGQHVFASAIKFWDNSMDAACKLVSDNIGPIRDLGLTGLIFTSSPGAFAAVGALRQNDLRVSEDISLVGEGDYESSRYMWPSLTVVTCDYIRMACRAIDIMTGDELPAERSIFLECKLIERSSVRENRQ